jgi:hypothetical protein
VFTSWKLDILDGMMSDPRVKDSDFRIAFRVMQSVNCDTRIGIISDLTLCDEVPSTDRFRCNDTRKRLSKLGWWTVEVGHGGKASRYHFSIANRDAVLDQRLIDKEARDQVRAEKKRRDRRRREGRGGITTQIPAGDVVNEPRGRGQSTTGTPSLSPTSIIYEEEEALLAVRYRAILDAAEAVSASGPQGKRASERRPSAISETRLYARAINRNGVR